MDVNGGLIRNIIFPLMESLKGNNIRKNLKYLQNTQSLPRHELKALQENKLKVLLTYCIERVPAYSDYGDLRKDINRDPFAALDKFPILTKKKFMESPDSYLSSNVEKSSLVPNRTGGSTGEPVKFYIDRKTVEFYEAARWRGLSWSDINIGDRSVMIWGSPIELGQQQRLVYKAKERFLKNRIIIPAYDLNPKSINQYMDTINAFKPKYFYGYASSLTLFADMMLSSKTKLNFLPKGVVSTAETLHDFQREKIERAFGCKVINEYGARDGGILAYQCQKGNMHITFENAVIEIVDLQSKKRVDPGNSGLLLVTDLNNFSMPRLRYQLGDVASISAQACTCEVTLPMLEKIQGREDDTFVSLEGSFVHGHFFNHIARNFDGIKQFQIIQHERNRLSLKIVKGQNFQDSEVRYFIDKITKAMGRVEVRVEFVEAIPTSGSGKIRYAIREFPLNSGN